MGIPLLQGRFFTSSARLDSEKVVVIDSVLANTFFPGRDPVGQTLTVAIGAQLALWALWAMCVTGG
jgi:hypothetical protein